MKISTYFHDYELVPRQIHLKYGNNSKWFLRPELVRLADFYRSWFEAPIYINNWYWGGGHHNRGFRTPNTTVGSLYSQHKLGNAFDCNIKGLSADQVRKEIMDNAAEFMAAGLTTLEDGHYAPTWIHSDMRWTDLDYIFIVKP